MYACTHMSAIRVYIRTYMRVRVYLYILTCAVYTCLHTHILMYMCVRVYVYILMYTQIRKMCTCPCVTNTHKHTDTHTHISCSVERVLVVGSSFYRTGMGEGRRTVKSSSIFRTLIVAGPPRTTDSTRNPRLVRARTSRRLSPRGSVGG